MKTSAIIGRAPRGHHRDILCIERRGRGRGEGRMRMRRMRMSRMRMARSSVRPHRRRGTARMTGERVMRRIRLHSVLPGRRLLPSKNQARISRLVPSSTCDAHMINIF